MSYLTCISISISKPKYSEACHDLWMHDNGQFYQYSTDEGDRIGDSVPIELYLISDREKKEGDWCICLNEIKRNSLRYPPRSQSPFIKWKFIDNCDGCRKIEATTDILIFTPFIPQTFIDAWIFGEGKIKEVSIKMTKYYEPSLIPSAGYRPEVIVNDNKTEVMILLYTFF